MSQLSYNEINGDVLEAIQPPKSRLYYLTLALFAAGIGWAAACWVYQVKTGMGVTGLNNPVGWATYITNFVFWIGIGHAGTLISAILYLVRSRWRVAVSRAAEAMTVFAVMTAGLFPLVHLGRLWVFYFIIPYPSERQIWPDFFSPLIWDVCAVTTYMTVSIVFWFVGLWPDLASARDHTAALRGESLRTKLYRLFSLGWCGSGNQWRHHGRGYLFFAALATPLVISVHSVVSWDFAMSLLPGWHSTIFAPYFVAGAIHSGLAMVLTLLIPLRKVLKLERVIQPKHFEAAALTMIVTTLIVGYTYLLEPFMSWYSTDKFETQFAAWRATGWFAWGFWLLPTLNVLVPLALVFRRVRRNLKCLMVISILVNVGMWMERIVIIVTSTAHDFLPHNWDWYCPRWPELSITIGSFCFFFFWFFGFVKVAPAVAISDVKEDATEGTERYYELAPESGRAPLDVRKAASGVLAVFTAAAPLEDALRSLRKSAFDAYETYSPVRLREAESIMGRGKSPVRYWTLTGALLGAAGGFYLALGSALVNNLIAGGKSATTIVPYFIIAFEGLILIGALSNLAGVLHYCRLGRGAVPKWYDRRFSNDRFGLFVACPSEQFASARALLAPCGTEEIRDVT